jgi:hypothetical protein
VASQSGLTKKWTTLTASTTTQYASPNTNTRGLPETYVSAKYARLQMLEK